MKIMIPATNKMRSAALALCAFAVVAAPVWAQDATPPPPADGNTPAHAHMERVEEHHLQMLSRELSLTPDQVTQIKAIDQDTLSQMMAARQDTSMAPADKHEKMKSIHEAQTAKIRAVLTEAQQPKFDKMVAEQKERMEQRHGQGAPGQPPAPPAQ